MALIAPAAAAVGPRGDRPLGQYLTQLEQASVIKMLDNLMIQAVEQAWIGGRLLGPQGVRLLQRGHRPAFGA